jgi:hypothetical protein
VPNRCQAAEHLGCRIAIAITVVIEIPGSGIEGAVIDYVVAVVVQLITELGGSGKHVCVVVITIVDEAVTIVIRNIVVVIIIDGVVIIDGVIIIRRVVVIRGVVVISTRGVIITGCVVVVAGSVVVVAVAVDAYGGHDAAFVGTVDYAVLIVIKPIITLAGFVPLDASEAAREDHEQKAEQTNDEMM